MRSQILPVLAAGLVVVGCSGSTKEEPEAPESSAAAQSANENVDSKNGPARRLPPPRAEAER